MLWLIPLLLVGALVVGGRKKGTPLTFAELSRSSTARRFGIDNTIPPALHARARGLAIVAGELRGLGLRINSAYRSPLLNALILALNEDPQSTPDPSLLTPSVPTRPHVALIALDLDDDTNSITRTRALLAQSRHAAHVKNNDRTGLGLNEGNHVHVEWPSSYLESLDDGGRT